MLFEETKTKAAKISINNAVTRTISVERVAKLKNKIIGYYQLLQF